MNFDHTVKIKNKTIKFRKWKVKDKKKFLSDENNQENMREALVFDCLEDSNICLSEEEFKYLFMMIREKSIKEKVGYVFDCSECNEKFEYFADLEEVMKPEYKDVSEIQVNNHIFTLGSIRNQSFYNQAMDACTGEEKYLVDFILHISKYNDEPKTFDQLQDVINEMDIDEFETIYKKWEDIRYKVNQVHDVECPKCGHVEALEFDDLPGFFPDSWNV